MLTTPAGRVLTVVIQWMCVVLLALVVPWPDSAHAGRLVVGAVVVGACAALVAMETVVLVRWLVADARWRAFERARLSEPTRCDRWYTASWTFGQEQTHSRLRCGRRIGHEGPCGPWVVDLQEAE